MNSQPYFLVCRLIFALISSFFGFVFAAPGAVYTYAGSNLDDKTNGIIRSDRSMVSGGSVSEKTMKNVNETVKEFVDKCNDNKPEEAYDMLTDNCKEAIYPNYEDFYENYI